MEKYAEDEGHLAPLGLELLAQSLVEHVAEVARRTVRTFGARTLAHSVRERVVP